METSDCEVGCGRFPPQVAVIVLITAHFHLISKLASCTVSTSDSPVQRCWGRVGACGVQRPRAAKFVNMPEERKQKHKKKKKNSVLLSDQMKQEKKGGV